MTDVIKRIISQNNTWAQNQKENTPDYFVNLTKGQSPSIFWVGCCDSRVIPSEICRCSLGDMFIQTNIANQIHADDLNTMSSLEYAVNVLKVDHIIICGHTFCGGVMAAMSNATNELPENIRKWIKPIANIYQAKKETLPTADDFERATALSRANIRHQVKTTTDLEFIQNLSKKGGKLTIHGWLFHMGKGTIEKLEEVTC